MPAGLRALRLAWPRKKTRKPAPTGRRFPSPTKLSAMTAVVPEYRCGAAPDSHRLPSSVPWIARGDNRQKRYILGQVRLSIQNVVGFATRPNMGRSLEIQAFSDVIVRRETYSAVAGDWPRNLGRPLPDTPSSQGVQRTKPTKRSFRSPFVTARSATYEVDEAVSGPRSSSRGARQTNPTKRSSAQRGHPRYGPRIHEASGLAVAGTPPASPLR